MIMAKLVQLTDSNSLFIRVRVKDGSSFLFIGSREKIAKEVGVDCPMYDSSLVKMVERVYKNSKVEKISQAQASLLLRKVNDSKEKVIVY